MSDDQCADGTERTECWRCGYERLIYESCPECGGSCKPLTKQKQQSQETGTDQEGDDAS